MWWYFEPAGRRASLGSAQPRESSEFDGGIFATPLDLSQSGDERLLISRFSGSSWVFSAGRPKVGGGMSSFVYVPSLQAVF